jgi:hypothetical protein
MKSIQMTKNLTILEKEILKKSYMAVVRFVNVLKYPWIRQFSITVLMEGVID